MTPQIFTKESFDNMKSSVMELNKKFCETFDKMRESVDTSAPDFDCEELAIPMEDIEQHFYELCKIMNLETTYGSFRDNETEAGRYSEHNDCVCLPLCIDVYPAKEICLHMCHELFHAFQYYSIVTPANYPCFDVKTIDVWKYEFKNYYNGIDNKVYASQEIETSARAFAASVV